MKILAVIASPRQSGRTARLAQEILRGAAEAGHQTDSLYLVDLDLRDCLGCMQCQATEQCVIRDDIESLEAAIREHDVIVWASPTHWANVSAVMLRAWERLFGFLLLERRRGMPVPRKAAGKRAILVTACSTPWPWNYLYNQSRGTLSRMREVCRYTGQRVVATLVLPGTLGMTDIPPRYLERARQIGRTLA